MTQERKTVEFAKIYETQGYYKDAFDIYSFLNRQTPSEVTSSGYKRMEKKMEETSDKDLVEENISRLIEKWLMLVILEQQLDTFKKIKSRFV